MISIILSLSFTLGFAFLAFTAFFIGAMKGRRFVWQLSLTKVILNLVSVVIAVILSSLCATLVSSVLFNVLETTALFNAVNELGLGLSLEGMAAVLGGAVMGAILFLPIFAITRCFAKLFLKLITKLLLKITEKKRVERADLGERRRKKYDEFRVARFNVIGALCGGVSGLITLLVLFIPVVGALNTVNDITNHALMASDVSVLQITAEAVDASANNVGAKALKILGGEAIFEKMTYCEAGEDTTSVTLKEDLVTVGEIVAVVEEHDLIETVKSDPMDVLADEECISDILLLIIDNPRFNHFVDFGADFVVTTMLNSVSVPEDVEPLYEEFLGEMEAVSGGDVDSLTKAYADVFDEYGIKAENATALLAAEAHMRGEDMRAWTLTNVVSSKEDFLSKTVRVSIHDITDGYSEITDSENEAHSLARVGVVLVDVLDEMDASEVDATAVFGKIGPALDALAKTQTVGPEKTKILLIGLLQSEMVHGDMGLSVLDATDTALSMFENSKTGGYEPLTLSLSSAFKAIDAASDPEKDTTAAVKTMLDDLTPSSSKVLQTLSTPSVLITYDVPEHSAGPAADMMSDMFGNLSSAKEAGMSDEEYEKEAVAVANMMDIVMSTDRTASNTFGEGSATGVTADEYVNNIMDSKVMSGTVMDTVYADGENATNNPLNAERQLSDAEKADVLTSINNRWESSDKSAETEKKLVSIASILNFSIEMTESGFAPTV